MKLADILDEAERLTKVIRTAKAVADRERAMVKVMNLADAHAFVDVPGLGGPRLAAKRAHLRETERSIEVAESKTAGGHPALGGTIRDLKRERDFLVRSIRNEEKVLLAAIETAGD